LSEPNYAINIDDILGDQKASFIPIADCETGSTQARQSGTDVTIDSKLVSAIRRTGGILQPIILRKKEGGKYEIIVGQRRTASYRILQEEDSKYQNIKAYVIERDLSDDEIRIISFVENFGRDDMEKSDYVNVIEYFYMKFGRVLKATARALGISTDSVKKYLTHARLSDKVKKCIEDKEFTIDTAMKALQGLGDDEDSVDDEMLIETALELKKAKPTTRRKAVKKMQKKGISAKQAVAESQATTEVKMEVTDETMDRLEEYKNEKGKETVEEAAVDAMETELFRGQEEA
jgi:ParB family transcriptional regulator, chromosome partitioning protein